MMKKVKNILMFSLMTLLFTTLFATPVFAANPSNWHVDLKATQQPTAVGQSFSVTKGQSVKLGIDQYVKVNGLEDKTKSANVIYQLYNVGTGIHVDFQVSASVGGALGAPATRTFTNMNGGTYVIRAVNLTSYVIASGGNVYVN